MLLRPHISNQVNGHTSSNHTVEISNHRSTAAVTSGFRIHANPNRRPDYSRREWDYAFASGFTLVELVLVITIIAILSAVAVRGINRILENTRFYEALEEMDILAEAMVGDPSIVQNNIRTNFGYTGDTGLLPPGLDDLITNVAGVVSWAGPYIDVEFTADPTGFKTDPWGQQYTYINPANPAEKPYLYALNGGDTIKRNIAQSVNAVLNNTVKVRLYNEKGTEINGTNGSVAILYSNSWHDMPYGSQGFKLTTVPIGLRQLRAISAGDTAYQSISVGPGNSTTGGTIEMTVYPNYGSLTYRTGSASVSGAGLNEVFFDVTNTGSSTFEINKMIISWEHVTGNCWMCKTSYLDELYKSPLVYWKWNTSGRNARVPSGAQINLDANIKLYTGHTTIGRLLFMDAVTGTGSAVNMKNTSFTIKFLSSAAPTQTITFTTPGTCTAPSVAYVPGSATRVSNYFTFTVQNNGIYADTFSALTVNCNTTTSTMLTQVNVPMGTMRWTGSPLPCNQQDATATFGSPATINGSSTQTVRTYFATAPDAGTPVTVKFPMTCMGLQTISFNAP